MKFLLGIQDVKKEKREKKKEKRNQFFLSTFER
jgi:hypothetical protein